MDSGYEQLKTTLTQVSHNVFNIRALVIILGAIIGTLLVIKLLGQTTNALVKRVIKNTEKSENPEKAITYRRVETWLNVFFAAFKFLIIVLAAYVTWRLLNPGNAPIAVIGASALFIVLASATVGPLLQDITAGSMMIAERWYGVGDYIKVEPYDDLQGVVEQLTLRSTKIRSLKGEIVWMRNQNVQAVKVKYRGVSRVALDVFVSDKTKALKLLKGIIDVVPKGPMLVIGGLEISDLEQLNETMWRIELEGKTVPGREWLIEKFAIDAILDADKHSKNSEKIIVYGPIARNVDPAAERRFKRAIK